MHNYLKVIILLLAVTFSTFVSGQINFKKGYVITNNNDTVYGRINDGGASRNAKVCLFKECNGKKMVKYHPGDIKAYRLIGDKFYASKEIEIKDEPKAVFLEVVLKGEVNLYHHWKNKNMAYYIEKDNKLIGLFDEEVLVQALHLEDRRLLYGEAYLLANRSYMDTLHSVFKDSKEIQDRIYYLKYKEPLLANITKGYILEKCKGENCITYERDHKMYKPTMGIYSGVRLNQLEFYSNYYSYTEKSEIFSSTPIGVFFNFPFHHLSDKLSFQLEILSTRLNYSQKFGNHQKFMDNTQINIKNNTIGVPLLLKYEFGNGNIRPTIGIGKEFAYGYQSEVTINQENDLKIHSNQKGNWLGEVGLNYQLAKRFTVFANVRVQKNDNIIIEEQFQSTPYKTLIEKGNIKRRYTNLSSAILIGIEF